jgi:hypothetical protein
VVELVPPEEEPWMDEEFVEFSYRIMKGIVAIAVIESPRPPTLQEFVRVVNDRIGMYLEDLE